MVTRIFRYSSISINSWLYFELIETNYINSKSYIRGKIIFSEAPPYYIGQILNFNRNYCEELNQEEINYLNKKIIFS